MNVWDNLLVFKTAMVVAEVRLHVHVHVACLTLHNSTSYGWFSTNILVMNLVLLRYKWLALTSYSYFIY